MSNSFGHRGIKLPNQTFGLYQQDIDDTLDSRSITLEKPVEIVRFSWKIYIEANKVFLQVYTFNRYNRRTKSYKTSAVLTHGPAEQLSGSPTSIAAHVNLYMLYTACFFNA